MSQKNDFPEVNTFTAENARRLSEESLSFPEMYAHEIAEMFDSDISLGHDRQSVKSLRSEYGDNTAAEIPVGFLHSLKRQLKNSLTVLCFFACIMFYFFRFDVWLLISAGGILLTVAFNALLEYKSGRIFSIVQGKSSPRTTVIREGKQFVTSSRSLVPGDVIVLESDSIVPADARLIESSSLMVLETPVNGTRSSVMKDARYIAKDKSRRIYENMVYSGSVVTAGRGIAIVCATGKNTLISAKISGDTSLPKQLKSVMTVGKAISFAAVISELLIMIFGAFGNVNFSDAFIVALAVGASSLCDTSFALAAYAEAKGISEAMKKGCIFRNLDSFEKIASCDTVMCGKEAAFPPETVSLRHIYTCFDLHELNRKSGQSVLDVVRCMLLCSSVTEKLYDKKPNAEPVYEGGEYTLPLLESAMNAGYTLEDAKKGFLRIDAEFDSQGEAKRVLGMMGSKTCVILRGSPENVLARCAGYRTDSKNYKLDAKARDRILADASEMARNQIPIAVAMGYTNAESLLDISAEKKLIFLGFAGFSAATRVDAASSVFRLNSSGISIAIRTDDTYYTAYNLAKSAGVLTNEGEICTDEILHDTDEGLFIADNEKYKLFTDLTDEEWLYILRLRNNNKHKVFAGISEISQLPVAEEANASFAISGKGSDALVSACDVRLTEGGFNLIEGVMKQSKLITKKILNIMQYMTVGFLTMFFWVLFSIMFNGVSPLRVQDIFIYGMLVNPIFCYSLAFSPENRKSLSEKTASLTPKSMIKGILVSLGYSIFSALLCIASPAVTGKNGVEGICISIITYVVSIYLFSLMTGESRSVIANKFYRNYNLIISFVFAALVTLLPIYVPAIRDLMGYAYVFPADSGVAAALPIILFLVIQGALLILENTSTKKKQ